MIAEPPGEPGSTKWLSHGRLAVQSSRMAAGPRRTGATLAASRTGGGFGLEPVAPDGARECGMEIETLFPLKGKRVWVAGHRGMVGSAIVRRLAGEACEVLTVERAALDLTRQHDVD